MIINPITVVTLLSLSFNPNKIGIDRAKVKEDEQLVHDYIEDIIRHSIDNPIGIGQEKQLDFNGYDSGIFAQAIDESDTSQDYTEVPTCLYRDEPINFDYKKLAVAFWQSAKTNPLSLESVKKKLQKSDFNSAIVAVERSSGSRR